MRSDEPDAVRPPRPNGRYAFDEALAGAEPGQDLIAVGADLDPTTLLQAYAHGLFPMGVGEGGAAPIGWWSPDPRGVLPIEAMRVSRSLRAACRRFEVRCDSAFEAVVAACADPSRPGAWITDDIARAYSELFRLGLAHSVECWQGDRLVGGLYGVAVAGLFAGESMFHHVTDASKVALVALVELLAADGVPGRLLDVQWSTPHLASLGVVEVGRGDYLAALATALTCAEVTWPAPGRGWTASGRGRG